MSSLERQREPKFCILKWRHWACVNLRNKLSESRGGVKPKDDHY